MNKITILGVHVDNLSLQEVLEKINTFLQLKTQHYVVTPNPEFLVAAHHDKQFKQILNYADIAIADGVGLQYAAKLLGKKISRVTGTDLVGFLCELAEQKNYPLYLLGGQGNTAQLAAEVLKNTFPKIRIVGAESGGQISSDGKTSSDAALIEKINQVNPKILLVAFGQVKQEKWIFHHLDQLNSVKVAIGVGGALDYIAGNVKRAPELWRTLGLEWLYRLWQEPQRWHRIFTALVLFPGLVLLQKCNLLKSTNEPAPNN